MQKVELIFSPFRDNVLDYIDQPLEDCEGRRVIVRRQGSDFVVLVGGVERLRTPDNLEVSFYLNTLVCSIKG